MSSRDRNNGETRENTLPRPVPVSRRNTLSEGRAVNTNRAAAEVNTIGHAPSHVPSLPASRARSREEIRPQFEPEEMRKRGLAWRVMSLVLAVVATEILLILLSLVLLLLFWSVPHWGDDIKSGMKVLELDNTFRYNQYSFGTISSVKAEQVVMFVQSTVGVEAGKLSRYSPSPPNARPEE